VVIRRSTAAEVRQLIDQLLGDDPLRRDVGAARLAIIGGRAVAPLLEALAREPAPPVRAAILRALEAIQDPRALEAASQAADEASVEVAAAGIGVLRAFLRSSDASLSDAAFERLTAVVLNTGRCEPTRAAALEALSDLPAPTIAEVLRQLHSDPSAALRRAAKRPGSGVSRRQTLAEVAAATGSPSPGELRALIAAEAPSAPLPVLARVLDLIHEREAAEDADRRTEWQSARGVLHQALAARGSRLALYDLRETLASVPGPLPVGFIAALERVGDASCLEPIAAAYVRAARAKDAWWIEHLQSAFRAIVRRERLTRRSAAVRQVTSRWQAAARDLWPARR
jgi:hypothetical protein